MARTTERPTRNGPGACWRRPLGVPAPEAHTGARSVGSAFEISATVHPQGNGHVSHIPPIIHSARADGSVYLLRWQELEPRVWCAEIAWVQRDTQGWHSQQATVMADDLTPIEGQNYKTVPRQVLRDRFRAPAC
jgi:hypothetical protein